LPELIGTHVPPPMILMAIPSQCSNGRYTVVLTSSSYVSPRLRAKRTLELLGLFEKCPCLCEQSTETEQLVEWDYGDYEGLTSPEIREHRRTNAVLGDRPWDIWRDGCVGGESPEDVERRCDALIKAIREQWHGPAMHDGNVPGDVVCVAHGHLLRAFAMRWVGKSISNSTVPLILEAGGVGILRFAPLPALRCCSPVKLVDIDWLVVMSITRLMNPQYCSGGHS